MTIQNRQRSKWNCSFYPLFPAPKYFLPILIFFFLFSKNYGNSFIIKNPSIVKKGSVFKVKIILQKSKENEKIKIYGDNFEFLGQSDLSTIKSLYNGRFTENKIYTYLMKPKSSQKSRTIFLTVEVGKQKKSVKIKIVNPSQNKSSISKISSQFYLNRPTQKSVLIRNRISKKKLLVNEIATLETEIYSDFAVNSYKLANSYKQSCYNLIPISYFPSQRNPKKIKQKKYLSSVIYKYIIYSPKKGKCTIEEILYRITLIQPGFFFNKKVKMDVKSLPVEFEVTDYPKSGRPKNFQFHYGDYHLRFKLSSHKPEVNNPIKLSVTISGIGNFVTLNEPDIGIPSDLTLIKDKVIDNFAPHRYTLKGSKTYHYYLTFHKTEPSYDALVINFSYYSPSAQSYKQIQKKISNIEIIPFSGYNPLTEDKLIATSPIRRKNEIKSPPQLFSPYFGETLNSKFSFMKLVGWYHLLGILGSLMFWIRMDKHRSKLSQSKFQIKNLYNDIIHLKNIVDNNYYEKNITKTEKVDLRKLLLTELKKLVVNWTQKIYNIKSEKGWDKEVTKFTTSPNLSSCETTILQNLQIKVNSWEKILYYSDKLIKEDVNFDFELEETNKLLKELIYLSSSRSETF